MFSAAHARDGGAELALVLLESERGVRGLPSLFLDRAPGRAAWHALDALGAGCDRFHAAGTDIYLHCPTGFARTKLTNNAVERALAVRATSRNWNTVTKLVAMAAE
jgi:hypothetical protein